MKTLKGWIPTTVLAATLLFGSVTAHAGDGIIYGLADSGTKQQACTVDTKFNSGIIYGLTGIIYGFTGIIYGYTGTKVTCSTTNQLTKTGIIVTD